MSVQVAYKKIKDFLENRKAPAKAFSALKTNIEIAVDLAGSMECTLLQKDGKVYLEPRPAQNPKVSIFLKPESIDVFCKLKGDELSEFSVTFFKELLAGNIVMQVNSDNIALLQSTYAQAVKHGGQRFASAMGNARATGVAKISSAFKKIYKPT